MQGPQSVGFAGVGKPGGFEGKMAKAVCAAEPPSLCFAVALGGRPAQVLPPPVEGMPCWASGKSVGLQVCSAIS